MTESTSRVVSSCSKSGLRAPGVPTSASTAVPPFAGFGTVAIGWHPYVSSAESARTEIPAMRVIRLLDIGRDPDVGHRGDQKGDRDDPGRPVDLALQAA